MVFVLSWTNSTQKNSPERGPSEAVCEVWTRTNLQAALKELQVPAVDNK